MAPTKFGKFGRLATSLNSEVGLLGCLLILPYASYLALLGMTCLTFWIWLQQSQPAWRLVTRRGWLVLALGMGITAVTAYDPVEAGLQLTNFLPFFLFFAALSVWIGHLQKPLSVLETWSLGLVLGSIPISLRAAVEYYLKSPSVEARLFDSPYFSWLYNQVDYGHRASSVFGHPNVLGAYLVIILGLALGLGLKVLRGGTLVSQWRWRYWPLSLYSAIALALLGIFCSGSRSGVLVAIAQILIVGWLMRHNRLVLVLGLSGITAVSTAVLALGIGGRSVGEALTTTTLRVDVWEISLNLIRQHPWLGTGLGGFRLSYVPYTIPQYDTVEHAHNLWLMLAAEIGIPLMLLFTAIVGWVCYQGLKTLIGLKTQPFPRSEQAVLAGYGLAFMSCILFALFDVTFYDSRVNVLGWLTLAVIQAIPALAAKADAAATDAA
ncbi:MAG: O-antigen ligase family protein [Cyanobacteria bacterium Co-bin13]|nr:O-antigen ligase family protein [Cyanobacteria bacterium Co-bin13]